MKRDFDLASNTAKCATTRESSPTLVSIDEYRHLLGDTTSSNERITERLRFIEALCRNNIKSQLRKLYDQATKGQASTN